MVMIRYRRDLNQIIDISLPAVEVGVAEGYFSQDMLAWGLPKLFMVDFWGTIQQAGDASNPQSWHEKNLSDAMERVKKYGDKAVILRGFSVAMAEQVQDNSLGLVYIDCDHSYKGVMADINAWLPKLIEGGIMAFHDYENRAYGVKAAVQEFCNGKFKIQLLPEDKEEDAGAYFINK